MELKEFNDALAKILGIKGEVTWASVQRLVETGDYKIYLIVAPTKNQIPKILDLITK